MEELFKQINTLEDIKGQVDWRLKDLASYLLKEGLLNWSDEKGRGYQADETDSVDSVIYSFNQSNELKLLIYVQFGDNPYFGDFNIVVTEKMYKNYIYYKNLNRKSESI